MNISLRSTELDKDLESAKAVVAITARLITHAMKEIDAWLEANDRMASYESVIMAVHADKIRSHCVALEQCVADLSTPSKRRVLLLSSGMRILNHEQISETSDAYDNNKLNNLDERDIRDAIEFNTELKDMFGLAWIDDEISEPLRDALHLLYEMMEDGITILPGTVVRVLKVLLKGHPRGFGRYYTGIDPWPRPSAQIQAEIDAQLPDALDWLRYELREALAQEADSANSAGGSAITDERRSRCVPAVTSDVQDGLPPLPRSLPIEADNARRQQIEADPTIHPDHLETLYDLKLLLSSDAEKNRVYCGTLDQEAKDVLDHLLKVAIREIEVEYATVIGVVSSLILAMLDIRVALGRNELGRLVP